MQIFNIYSQSSVFKFSKYRNLTLIQELHLNYNIPTFKLIIL